MIIDHVELYFASQVTWIFAVLTFAAELKGSGTRCLLSVFKQNCRGDFLEPVLNCSKDI